MGTPRPGAAHIVRKMVVPPSVYLDTSFVVATMMRGTVHHEVTTAFYDELIAQGSTIYFSTLLRAELLQSFVAIGNNPRSLTQATRRLYRLQHWGRDEAVRQTWLNTGLQQFESFLNQFTAVNEIILDAETIASSTEVMARFQLKSYDAIHVASAVVAGVRDIATVDIDFL